MAKERFNVCIDKLLEGFKELKTIYIKMESNKDAESILEYIKARKKCVFKASLLRNFVFKSNFSRIHL